MKSPCSRFGVRLLLAGGLALVALLPSFLCAATVSLAPEALRDLDAFIEKEMARDRIPGLALAIVQGDRVLWMRGYGHRDVEKKLPVTPKTAFAIGSITKSFTVATLGALAQQGKLDWDKPVREYLPEFKLRDPVATELMTARDLVTHRSGLPRHDMLWYENDLSRRDYFLRLRHLEPSADFRGRYQYNNLMFMTAGYLAGEIGGATWEALVQREILGPLGMAVTTSSIDGLKRSAEAAVGYRAGGGNQTLVMPYTNIDAIAPAGALNSSVEDMSRYALMLLNAGRVNGRQIVAAQTVREMMTPQISVPDTGSYAELGQSHYGMGLGVAAYRGRRHVSHSGAIDGFIANLSLLPDERLGVVVLTNLNQSRYIHRTLTYRIYDRLLGLTDIDWAARFTTERAKIAAAESGAKSQSLSPRKPGTKPAHPLAAYAGTYQHPAYGTVTIALKAEQLTMRFRSATSPLEHYHFEVFRAPENRLNLLSRRKVMFQTDVNGELTGLAFKLDPEVDDIVFTRIPDAKLSEPALLASYAGRYENGSSVTSVALRGNVLTLDTPAQPLRELVPIAAGRFNVKGRSGYIVEFVRKEGAVTGLASYGPSNETFGRRLADDRASDTNAQGNVDRPPQKAAVSGQQ